MRTRNSLVVAGLTAAILGFILMRPDAVQPQSANALSDDVSPFRIQVGLTDSAPKAWQGSVTVAAGELVSIQGWRFSQQDRVDADGQFQFRTKIAALENQLLSAHPYGQTDWGDKRAQRLIPEGLILRVKGLGRVKFSYGDESFEFAVADLPLGKRLVVLNGNGSVERMPVEERLSESVSADDYPSITVTPDGARWVAWLSYQDGADRVMASGAGRLHEVAGRGDHHSPAIASDGKGSVWVVWSQNDAATWHLYTRSFDGTRWSEAERLTAQGGSNLWPRLASDGQGRVAVVWQGFRNNQAVILSRRMANGRWGAETRVSEDAGNAWAPSAAFENGKLWVAWDSYATGAYQIYVRQDGGRVQRVTRGENFSVRPSIAVVGASLCWRGKSRTRYGARTLRICSTSAARSFTKTGASAWRIWTQASGRSCQRRSLTRCLPRCAASCRSRSLRPTKRDGYICRFAAARPHRRPASTIGPVAGVGRLS
jgi:hypothetical protein